MNAQGAICEAITGYNLLQISYDGDKVRGYERVTRRVRMAEDANRCLARRFVLRPLFRP